MQAKYDFICKVFYLSHYHTVTTCCGYADDRKLVYLIKGGETCQLCRKKMRVCSPAL